jgi:hypothetical protein
MHVPRRVAQGILHQIRERLCQQLPVAAYDDAGADRHGQAMALILRVRPIGIGNGLRYGAEVHITKSGAGGGALHLGDAQQGGERFKQPLCLGHHGVDRSFILRHRARACARASSSR